MRQRLVAGNWKMNGSKESTTSLLSELLSSVDFSSLEVIVCPPFVYLERAAQVLKGTAIGLGAQDVSYHEVGAFTGQVAASMLKDIGCHYVIIGHSECRQWGSDTDESIAQKFQQAKKLGLKPILCIGETEKERKDGLTEQVLCRQLSLLLQQDRQVFKDAVVAYEPVWAIGTGLAATPAQVQAAHHFIRSEVARYCVDTAQQLPILYGGSVKPGNAADLLHLPDVDGGLIGGASLVAQDFVSICRAAEVM